MRKLFFHVGSDLIIWIITMLHFTSSAKRKMQILKKYHRMWQYIVVACRMKMLCKTSAMGIRCLFGPKSSWERLHWWLIGLGRPRNAREYHSLMTYDDVMIWKRIPHYWSLVMVDSLHKGQVIRIFDILFVVILNNVLNNNEFAGGLRQHDVSVVGTLACITPP